MKDFFDDMTFNTGGEVPGGNRNPHKYTISPELTVAEYEELRLMLTSAKAAFADEDKEIIPNPKIKQHLRTLVAAQKKGFEWPSFTFKNILNFPVPAYQVGFAMILILFVSVFIGRNNNLHPGKNTIVVYKTDTVYEKGTQKPIPALASIDSELKTLAPILSSNGTNDSSNQQADSSTDTNNYRIDRATPNETPRLPFYNNNVQPAQHNTDTQPAINSGVNIIEDSSAWNKHLHG